MSTLIKVTKNHLNKRCCKKIYFHFNYLDKLDRGLSTSVTEKLNHSLQSTKAVTSEHQPFPHKFNRKLIYKLNIYLYTLGEGQFGKVYACVNLDTGEMMAVKQVRDPRENFRTV